MSVVATICSGLIFGYTNDLKSNLTEVRLLKMVNEAPKTIVSFARNRLHARLKCPWSYVREEREVLKLKKKWRNRWSVLCGTVPVCGDEYVWRDHVAEHHLAVAEEEVTRGCFTKNAATCVNGIELYFRLHRKGESESSESRLQRHACRKVEKLDPDSTLGPTKSQEKWACRTGTRKVTKIYRYILINHNYYFKIPLTIQVPNLVANFRRHSRTN
jgi:hypothetical protein